MKTRTLLLVAFSLFSLPVIAGNLMEWRDAGTPPYKNSPITSCGVPKSVDFIVTYGYNQSVNSVNGACVTEFHNQRPGSAHVWRT